MREDFRSKYKNSDDYSTIIKIDEFGFILDTAKQRNDEITTKDENEEWYNLLKSSSEDFVKLKNIIIERKLLKNEIPYNVRKRLWNMLVFRTEKPDNFTNLNAISFICKNVIKFKLPMEKLKNKRFEILKEKQSEYEYQIHVDIQRTFRKHYLFHKPFGKGQYELFNVLVAFANSNKDVGYCQGMSDIAAIFLIHYSESDAFYMMSRFFKVNSLEKIFDKKFSGLPQFLSLHRQILNDLIPNVFQYLNKSIDNPDLPFISWYLTLFTRFPIKLTLRVWDHMMFYGIKVQIYFTCSVLFINQEKIMKLNSEQLLVFINKIQDFCSDEQLIVDTVIGFMEKIKFKES